jgi:hypothetical protein
MLFFTDFIGGYPPFFIFYELDLGIFGTIRLLFLHRYQLTCSPLDLTHVLIISIYFLIWVQVDQNHVFIIKQQYFIWIQLHLSVPTFADIHHIF